MFKKYLSFSEKNENMYGKFQIFQSSYCLLYDEEYKLQEYNGI